MADLTDDQLDRIERMLEGAARPELAVWRHRIPHLVAEIRRLRDEAVTLRRAWRIEGDGLREHLARAEGEVDRLRDGIHRVLDMSPRSEAARNDALRALLDDQEAGRG